MRKAFFIVPQITHYRISFYEKLIQANPTFDWLIIDGEKLIDDGRPTLHAKFNFPAKRFLETTKTIGPFTFIDYEGLYEFVVKEKPDLVIMATIAGTNTYRKIASWCRQNGKQMILWSCLWEREQVSKSKWKFFKEIAYKRFINSASGHIAYSSYASKKLLKYGVPVNKIQIAYNGLDIDGLERYAIGDNEILNHKQDLKVSDNRILLYVGGLGKDKMVDLLLQSFAAFNNRYWNNNIKILIIGDGPQMTYLIKMSSDLGIAHKVIFLGRIVEKADVYFQLCDCYVLPGCGGLGINQAMYWQKPCIVSHADGTEEDLIIDDVTGFRFERSTISSLEWAITRFYRADNNTLHKMGVEAKKIIREKSNVNEMVNVFKSVIDAT